MQCNKVKSRWLWMMRPPGCGGRGDPMGRPCKFNCIIPSRTNYRSRLWGASKRLSLSVTTASAIIFSFFIWSSHAGCLARKWLQILFYEADVANEPPHVHITKEGNEAKFWLKPVKVEREGKFGKTDLRDIERIIEDNHDFLLDAWEKEKGKHVNG